MSLFSPVPDAVDELVCSSRGCRAEATWGLLWNNPKLHTPDRRKVWLACDEHREHLSQFLDCLLYTSPSPRDGLLSRMPSSA